jgi:hypothetical protein
MRLLVRGALLLALALPAAAVTPPYFGEPFPLTNTRYAATTGIPTLATNGSTLVLVWVGGESVRVARVVDGQRTTSEYVLSSFGTTDEAAVVWTGSNYLVAASSLSGETPIVTGRLLDANGTPIGTPFSIVTNASKPRLAANGSRVVLLYREEPSGDVYSRPLTNNGVPVQGTAPKKIAARTAFGPLYEVASNGSEFMAVSSSPTEVLLARFDASGAFLSSRFLADSQGSTRPRPATIASNGTNYLVVWFDFTRRAQAARLDATGATLSSVVFDEIVALTPVILAPKAVWSGTDWVIGYVHQIQLSQQLRVVHLDANVTTVTKRETEAQLSADTIAAVGLARYNNAVRVAWSGDRFPSSTGLSIATLPLTQSSGTLVTRDASDQRLLATAGNSAVSIFLWNELTDGYETTWLGISNFAGLWIERKLSVLAVSAKIIPGEGFLVLADDGDFPIAFRLDENGTQLGDVITFDYKVTDAAWNDFIWVLVGEKDGNIVAAEMTSTGQVSTTKLIKNQADSPAIASDGSGFLIVWRQEGPCTLPCNAPSIIHGTLIDDQRVRVDAADLDFSPSLHAGVPDVAWDAGSDRYDISWIDLEEVLTRQVLEDKSLSPSNRRLYLGLHEQKNLSLLSTNDTVAATWSDDGVTRLAFLNVLGDIDKLFTFTHEGSHVIAPAQLLNAPDGDTGIVFEELMPDAPFYGAARLQIAFSSPFVTNVPPPPALSATRLSSGLIELKWNTVDANLNGFRIESRIGNGPWLELEQFLPYTNRSTTFAPVSTERHSFRIRAYSDEGASAYSNEASVLFATDNKRRAVRK